MNREQLAYQAKAFYNAYINLEVFSRDSEGLLFLVPSIVNGAFSIELAMKTMLAYRGVEYKRDHNIVVLFDLLPSDIQDEIWKWVEKKAPEYVDKDRRHEELVLISDAFVQWRYCFEDGSAPALETRFLAAFANAAIGTMFSLGYNIDAISSGPNKSPDSAVLQLFEDNRAKFIAKNEAAIARRQGS